MAFSLRVSHEIAVESVLGLGLLEASLLTGLTDAAVLAGSSLETANQTPYTWLSIIAWASSKQGSWVPRARIPGESQVITS